MSAFTLRSPDAAKNALEHETRVMRQVQSRHKMRTYVLGGSIGRLVTVSQNSCWVLVFNKPADGTSLLACGEANDVREGKCKSFLATAAEGFLFNEMLNDGGSSYVESRQSRYGTVTHLSLGPERSLRLLGKLQKLPCDERRASFFRLGETGKLFCILKRESRR